MVQTIRIWNSFFKATPNLNVAPTESTYDYLYAAVWVDAELGGNGLYSAIEITGHYFGYALRGFSLLGAHEHAAVVKEIISILPSACLSTQHAKRIAALNLWDSKNSVRAEKVVMNYGLTDKSEGTIYELFIASNVSW